MLQAATLTTQNDKEQAAFEEQLQGLTAAEAADKALLQVRTTSLTVGGCEDSFQNLFFFGRRANKQNPVAAMDLSGCVPDLCCVRPHIDADPGSAFGGRG